MIKWILATLLVSSASAFACPNLEGNFKYSGASIISVSQSEDAGGITTYKVTIDDGTCAACHTDQYLKADGIVKNKNYDSAEEVTKVYCENNRLKFRQTTEYKDKKGVIAYTEKNYLDYRINANNNLAIENIENEIPISKVVHPRIY